MLHHKNVGPRTFTNLGRSKSAGKQTDRRMDATNRLFKFAAECEDMGRSARGEDQSAWRDLAQRWRQCANMNQRHGNMNQRHGVALSAAVERRPARTRAGRLRGVARFVSGREAG